MRVSADSSVRVRVLLARRAVVSRTWRPGDYILSGKVDVHGRRSVDKVTSEVVSIKRKGSAPVSAFVMTPYHFALLQKDAVSYLSRTSASAEPVQTEFLSRNFQCRGLAYDSSQNRLYLWSDQRIAVVRITNEDRNEWRILLDQGKYEDALERTKMSKSKRQVVLNVYAETLFRSGDYVQAARRYAETTQAVESVCMRFQALDSPNRAQFLREYLLGKLPHITGATQRTVLAQWVLEILLIQLNESEQTGAYKSVMREFIEFVREHHADLHPDLSYRMMARFGRLHEMNVLAYHRDDADFVVSYHMYRGDYVVAIRTLVEKKLPELFYRYCPALMVAAPSKTVAALLQCKRVSLDPVRLLPAMMQYVHSDDAEQNDAIVYLTYAVEECKCEDPAVLNYLLSQFVFSGDELAVLEFIRKQPHERFDIKYALRLCHERGLHRACVEMYCAMGLFEEAVNLALSFDLELAKRVAKLPRDADERKVVWLKIAKHVFEGGMDQDRKGALVFLTESEDLKIEDVLPFFPDSMLIDDFKDEICALLESYNQSIDILKHKMDEATKISDDIRTGYRQLLSRYALVTAEQECELCRLRVHSRHFYVFPCSHAFHVNCLLKNVRAAMSISERVELDERLAELERVSMSDDATEEAVDAARRGVDETLASSCPMCSETMIRSIDPFTVPLISDSDLDVDWRVDVDGDVYHEQ